MENAAGVNEPPQWFRQWLQEGKEKPKEPDVVDEINNLEISESVKAKIKTEMLFQAEQDKQKEREQSVNTLQEEKPETRKESGVFACQPEATSFITGEINVENTGNKFVVCPKILIDTGALVPSGIAVSEDFFVDHLGGEQSRLRPSQLLSANGATTTGSMKTVGEASVQIRFTDINVTFNGTAVVLKNLSLPIILGVNFLKTHSLSTFLTPNEARLVHRVVNRF